MSTFSVKVILMSLGCARPCTKTSTLSETFIHADLTLKFQIMVLSKVFSSISCLSGSSCLDTGPSIGLAVRENQSKNMPLKRIDLAKALDYTSF